MIAGYCAVVKRISKYVYWRNSMFTLGLDYIWYHNQRHEELLAMANRQHLIQEALTAGKPRVHNSFKLLGYIGKKLSVLGAKLEERYGVQPQTELPLNEQTTPGGC
jgi:hypothetical protein